MKSLARFIHSYPVACYRNLTLGVLPSTWLFRVPSLEHVQGSINAALVFVASVLMTVVGMRIKVKLRPMLEDNDELLLASPMISKRSNQDYRMDLMGYLN